MIGDHSFSPGTLWEHARQALISSSHSTIRIAPGARQRIAEAAAYVGTVARSEFPVYGVNTGVGHFADVAVAPERIEQLQSNLIRSHCCSVGEPLSRDLVLAMWLVRLNTICLGHSGTRLETVEAIVRLLEAGVLAVVPSRGSVGASGDLSPSAHAALPLLGDGWCTVPSGDGFRRVHAREVLAELGMEPLRLRAKEGLSLINGTQLTTALALKCWHEASTLLQHANLAAAMMIEGLHGSRQPLDDRVLKLHRHPGTLECGKTIAQWLQGPSEIHDSHSAVKWAQDPYSLRCAPQVHGAVWDEIEQAERLCNEEINAVADNPLLFPQEETALSCGNFHAIYMARACDRLASAMTTLASISERRTNLAMNSRRTGLPDFLIDDGGVQSGLMMAQVTAAALVSECKSLSFPASVDSIPTNNDQEDHVSMGPTAGFKALTIAKNLRWVLAVEMLAAAQAIDLRRPNRPAPRIRQIHAAIRRDVAPLGTDRVLSTDIETIAQRIEEGAYFSAWQPPSPHASFAHREEVNGHAAPGPPKPPSE
ncbi:MAG TPA: histidine ammonia-lyase [Pirellulales bacterium]|jgi:histidine ammonia-lyase|nr:histidine ammonia-lyase [Pirellulales bacterium]